MVSLNFRDPENRLSATSAPTDEVARPSVLCESCDTGFMYFPHKVSDEEWHVPSGSSGGFYEVRQQANKAWKCLCADAVYRGRVCKHIGAVLDLEAHLSMGQLPEIHIRYLVGK